MIDVENSQHPQLLPLCKHKWTRHTAMVPKGFIRYHVLKALDEKPLSGSELIEHIEKYTAGTWKPSPGSIYPLLAWLQNNSYISQIPIENGFKRYELTKNGKNLLEEQIKIRANCRENVIFDVDIFFDNLKIPKEQTNQIRISMQRLFFASIKLGTMLKDNYSEKSLNDTITVLNEASMKLEDAISKLGEKVE